MERITYDIYINFRTHDLKGYVTTLGDSTHVVFNYQHQLLKGLPLSYNFTNGKYVSDGKDYSLDLSTLITAIRRQLKNN